MNRLLYRICLVFLSISLASCQNSINTQQKVVQGTIDLSDWNFSRDGPANLNGEWRFFWRKQAKEISTSSVTNYVKIPDQWYNYVINGTNLPVFGYATYHIQIKHQLSNQIWGINFPDICASYNAWIDGKLVAQCGQFATNEKDNAMLVHPQLIYFYCGSNIINIVIEVANFIEVASGIPDAIYIGPQNLMSADQIIKLSFEFISFGIILITAFYHMFLFIFRSKEKYNLFFSLFCFTIAAKTSFEGDKFLYILIPNFSNHIYLALWCLALCASISLIYLYFYYLFPKETNRELMIFWQFVYGIYAVIILFFPIPVFSKLISIFQFLGLPVIVCTLYIVILATKQKREGALIVLIAFIVACATGVNDLLYGLGVIRTGFFLPYGFLLFILIQSYLISAKFSQAFKRNEKMGVVLQQTNESLRELTDNLENKINERTEQLEESNNNLRNFALIASHDLKSPMRTIKQFLSLIWESLSEELKSKADLKEYFDFVIMGSERMLKLINSLFAISSLNEKALVLTEMDVNEVLKETLMLLKSDIDENDAEIQLKDLPVINADRILLGQLFQNLISNALKYQAQERKVCVQITCIEKTLRMGVLHFRQWYWFGYEQRKNYF